MNSVKELESVEYLNKGCRVDKNKKQNGKQSSDKTENGLYIPPVSSGSTLFVNHFFLSVELKSFIQLR